MHPSTSGLSFSFPHGLIVRRNVRDAVMQPRFVNLPPILPIDGWLLGLVNRDKTEQSNGIICHEIPTILFGTNRFTTLLSPDAVSLALKNHKCRVVNVSVVAECWH